MENLSTFSRDVKLQRDKMPSVHCHKMHELYYMVKGNTTYYIKDEIFHINEGDFVLIPKGAFHKTAYEQKQHNERANCGDQSVHSLAAFSGV